MHPDKRRAGRAIRKARREAVAQLPSTLDAFASLAAWEVTRRRPGLLARTGRFVEIGPVTALHRDAVAALLPFPDLRMGWGLDAHWSAVAAETPSS